MTVKHIRTCPLERADMEDAIERLFSTGIVNQPLVIDIIDALTPADVIRQEVAFNVGLVANEGLTLSGRAPVKSLLKSTGTNPCHSNNRSSGCKTSRAFFTNACRQLAAIVCYFAAIYVVGVLILAWDVGLAAAIPLAIKTCAGKSLVTALIGPWIQKITGAAAP